LLWRSTMIKGAWALLASSLLLVAGVSRADDKDCLAIIDKAIKAVGGAERLAKYKAQTWKEKGTFYGEGAAQPYTGNYAVQWPDQFRMEIEGVFTLVLNGDKGSFKEGGKVQEMSKEQLAQQKESQYAGWVTTLLPLKEQAFQLSSLGESKVGNRPVVGVKVAHAGHNDIKLYFDKETGLLLRFEYRFKNARTGKDAEMVTLGSDFKEFNGLKFPTKIDMKQDGKNFVEAQILEVKPLEKLDPSLFAKP
jgi:hypothetical protein